MQICSNCQSLVNIRLILTKCNKILTEASHNALKTLKWRLSCRKERRYQKCLITFCVRNKWDMIIDMYVFIKKRKKYIYLLPCIQPHKLDSVNNCKTNEKKNCKESQTHPWGSRIGVISTWRPHSVELPWTLFRAFDWLLSQYSCIFSLQP